MYKILLADDKEVFLRTVLRMAFFQKNRERFQIRWTVCSAKEALAVLRREKVDIVITDIRMPMMSGLELLQTIQEEGLCQCTVLLSEYTEFAYARQGILYGAFDYLQKPLREAEIADTLERAYMHLQKNALLHQNGNLILEDLVREMAKSAPQEFLPKLREKSVFFLDRMQQGAAEQICNWQPILQQLSNLITVEYPFARAYLPYDELLTLPAALSGDKSAILAYTEKMLRFLNLKLHSFWTASVHPLVQKTWYYILHNIESACRLQEVASSFFVNASYLSALFKRETEVSFKHFVQQMKLERAKLLLGYSGMKMAEIAERLHFSDDEHFRKTFKAKTGISPSKFRYGAYIEETLGMAG